MAELFQTLLQRYKEARKILGLENATPNDSDEQQPTVITEEEEIEFLNSLEFDTPASINTLIKYSDSVENVETFSSTVENWPFNRNGSPSSSSFDTLESSEDDLHDDSISSSEDVPLIMSRELRDMRRASLSPMGPSRGSPASEGKTLVGSRRLSNFNIKRSKSLNSFASSTGKSAFLSSLEEKIRKATKQSISETLRKFFRMDQNSPVDDNQSSSSSVEDDTEDIGQGYSVDYDTDVSSIEYQLLSEHSSEDREEQTMGGDGIDGREDGREQQTLRRDEEDGGDDGEQDYGGGRDDGKSTNNSVRLTKDADIDDCKDIRESVKIMEGQKLGLSCEEDGEDTGLRDISEHLPVRVEDVDGKHRTSTEEDGRDTGLKDNSEHLLVGVENLDGQDRTNTNISAPLIVGADHDDDVQDRSFLCIDRVFKFFDRKKSNSRLEYPEVVSFDCRTSRVTLPTREEDPVCLEGTVKENSDSSQESSPDSTREE